MWCKFQSAVSETDQADNSACDDAQPVPSQNDATDEDVDCPEISFDSGGREAYCRVRLTNTSSKEGE